MTAAWPFAGLLLTGPLCSTGPWPYHGYARCCDLRPRFRAKSLFLSPRKGSREVGYRAIARNGRVLLCADRPMEELPGRLVFVRLQTWHRVYLPGEAPLPHGILLCVRSMDIPHRADAGPPKGAAFCFEMCRRPHAEAQGELRIEVGGGKILDFCASN